MLRNFQWFSFIIGVVFALFVWPMLMGFIGKRTAPKTGA